MGCRKYTGGFPPTEVALRHFSQVALPGTILISTIVLHDPDQRRRLLGGLPPAGPRGARSTLVLVCGLPLPLSARIEGCKLVSSEVTSVNRFRHWPVPQRGPDRFGTPSESRAHRDLTRSLHRRSPPPRPSTLVASERSEELTCVPRVGKYAISDESACPRRTPLTLRGQQEISQFSVASC
jgi:hypothetical protein